MTPVEKDWDAKHQEEHLRLYNPSVVADDQRPRGLPRPLPPVPVREAFPTKTRKLIFCGTNAEGWAHYTEQMMVDQGFGGGDPKIRLAQLQEALLRDCRYVVGIKLHTQGMTVEEGAKLFVEKGFQEPANGFEEARRGSLQPDLPLLHARQARDPGAAREYMQAKKATLKQFHDAFVAAGRPADPARAQDPAPPGRDTALSGHARSARQCCCAACGSATGPR